jgi:hypothetical protein
MSRSASRHWKISTGHHFQNGHHNTAQIQHCPISSKFDMWVDNDVPNWFLTLKNFYQSPFSKWPPQYCTNSTLSDLTTFHMWVNYDVPNRFPTLIMMSRIYSQHSKISSGRHFQNGHHNTTQIQHYLISTTFHMWVDYDVPNLFPTFKNF